MPPPFPFGPPLFPPTVEDPFSLPPVHPYLLSCGPLAMEWQQVFDSTQGELVFFHLPSGTIQQVPPLEGFVPVQLQQEADIARTAMAMHWQAQAGADAAAQHAQHTAATAAAAAAAAATLVPERDGPEAQGPAAAAGAAAAASPAPVAAAAAPAVVREWGAEEPGGAGSMALDAAPQHRFVRGAIDVSALEGSMQQPSQPPPSLHLPQVHWDGTAGIRGGQSGIGALASDQLLAPLATAPSASPPPGSLPPPPPSLHPPPFPAVLQPPTPVGLLAQTRAHAESLHERSQVVPPAPSLVPPHAAYRSSSGSPGAQPTTSTSSGTGSSRKTLPPGFVTPPPQPRPRPETTGMLPSLPRQGGIHTYFESTDSMSGGHTSAAAGVSSAPQGSVHGVDGVQGSGTAEMACGVQAKLGEVTSKLQYFAEAEETGEEVAGAIQGIQTVGHEGAQEVRAERVLTRGKKQKKKRWPEVQGDDASEAREAALKKAMAATMALLPDGEQEESERVVMDPSLAAYVRSILPRNVAKYWLQRYSLFTKYDEGIQLDTEGLWCAGNAIQLTKDFSVVYAVEISKRRADMARNNAEVYGVGSQVEVLCTDFFKAAPLLFAEAIFVSPPWGGPKYKWCETFEVLETVEGMAFSIKHLVLTALDVVRRSTTFPASHPRNAAGHQQRQPSLLEASGSKLCAGVRSLLAAAASSLPTLPMHPSPPPIPRFVSGTFDLASLEAKRSQEPPLPTPTQHMASASSRHAPPTSLHLASGATKCTTQGVVAVFLPRNTDLKQLESLVPEGKVWHVERNYVNGRLKGVSFYCFS
ncbi:RNA cap guanine-N2 methyltransferase-domain-containing protein, partial [Dunaliella salina]